MLTDVNRKNRLQWTQDNKPTNWKQVIFSDETTIRLSTVKGLIRKKEDRTNRQAFDQDERLGLLFKSRFCSHCLFQTELKC